MEKLVTQEWREREKKRFRDNIYKRVPWDAKTWFSSSELANLHYPHVSVDREEEGMLSFTPSEDKGVNDRQTVMKPRRYIQKYLKQVIKQYIGDSDDHLKIYWAQRYEYAHTDAVPHEQRPDSPVDLDMDKEVEYWAGKFEFLAKPIVYHRAMSREAIRWVYLNCTDGARSCMTHPTEDFNKDGVHPVEAYAAGDLAIAFMYEEAIPPQYSYPHPRVVARAVTWLDKKIYGRIYGKHGYEVKLKQALTEDGYTDGDLVGARMLKIIKGGEAVFPYLDNNNGVDECYPASCYVICYEGEGEYKADSQEGRLNEQGYDFYCTSCDEGHTGDDYYTTPNGNQICDSCYSEYFFTCYTCDDVTNVDDGQYVDSGGHADRHLCETCLDNEAFDCNQCGAWKLNTDLAGEDGDGDQWCEPCFENEGMERTDCGEVVKPKVYTVTVAECSCCEPKELEREEA